ncbi:MAG: ABC transporter permease [Patescibacteria group bacterium]|jgi:putative ABC transport system permease protein
MINEFTHLLTFALEDFKRNKLRTFLTSLGIMIGVSSVVLLLSLGLGLKEYIRQQFESLGTNLVMVMPGSGFGGGNSSIQSMGSSMFGTISFDNKDYEKLKRIKNAEFVVPFFIKFLEIKGEKDSQIVEVGATTEEVYSSMNLELDQGSFFDKADVDRGLKVLVLGPTIAEKLFGSIENSIGKTVDLGEQNFKIVGVFKSKGGGGLGGSSIDDHVFIPFKSASAFNPDKDIYAFYIKSSNESVIPQLKEDIKKVLLKRYKKDEFSVGEMTDILSMVNQIFEVLNLVLVSIGAISLLVGGIGIMNIMYVSVYERIKEIGIRRAFGATNSDIMSHFISEAIFLSLFGGLVGLVFSYLVVLGIRLYFPAYIDIWSVIIALTVSSGIGIVFGIIPAKKASSLDPVEAMRYE